MEEEVEHTMRQYWPVRRELVVIEGAAMKGKRTETATTWL